VIRRQHAELRRSLRGLRKEGFRTVHVLHGEDEIAAASITRTRLFNDLRHETGRFDVIGDIHGCAAELQTCWPTSATASSGTSAAARPAPAIRTGARSSSATWSTADPTRRACFGW
jgi:hypothetical protein